MQNNSRKLKINYWISLEEDNTKIQNVIKEVSKGERIIMGDFNHGHIQWKSLESTGVRTNNFYF